jgi:ABC-2 type transport system ATP-binding protein
VKSGTLEELMENAGHEHIIRLTLSNSANGVTTDLQHRFPTLHIEAKEENACFISSPERIPLSPILQYLDSKGISVFEAKEMRPTLEDVFVKVTGIEAGKLHKEKEGKK